VTLAARPEGSVLDALCARFPRVGRETWLDRFRRGRVRDAMGATLAPQEPQTTPRVVHYWREVPAEVPVPFEERVLHVDERIVVADKPPFLAVMPAGRYVADTLVARLQRRLGRSVVALHRLDRATAGLVLLSVDPATRGAYQALFRERRIVKVYEALARPLPEVEFPRVARTRLEPGVPFFRMRVADGPPNAETHVDVLERGATYWRYALRPVTGRKHQLRVQMAALGAPIVGDRFYPDVVAGPEDWANPLRLVARGLEFDDPVSGEPRRFRSTLTVSGPAED
jgi:tRNA pseudouridine32 synthase/23S rRNA pseudouridine746 synthase